MSDIEKKAMALVDEVKGEKNFPGATHEVAYRALCRAIEQHEAFRQEVSDVVADLLKWPPIKQQPIIVSNLSRFIVAKPDPLVEAMHDCGVDRFESWANQLREAIAKRGGKIVWEEGK